MNNIRYPPAMERTVAPNEAELEQLLSDLKLLTDEGEHEIRPGCGGCTLCAGPEGLSGAMFTDEELKRLLMIHGWQLRRTAYAVLLRKAETSNIRFPSGLTLPDGQQYYLRLARQTRPNKSGTAARADGV